jgi:hypothetical protein
LGLGDLLVDARQGAATPVRLCTGGRTCGLDAYRWVLLAVAG